MKRLFIYLLLVSPVVCFAQNTGYAGKKFILKTDALRGKDIGFRSIEAEYVFAKHFSISVGAGMISGSYGQTITEGNEQYFLKQFGRQKSTGGLFRPSLPNASISGMLYKTSVRAYTGKLITKAPRGFYIDASYETGYTTLTNGVLLGPILDDFGRMKDYSIKRDMKVENVLLTYTEGFMGYQEIFRGLIVLDISAGLSYSTFNSNGTDETLPVTTLAGPNIGPNAFIMKNSANGPITSNIGVSAYIKLGVLLF